jgi:hypothetical protein
VQSKGRNALCWTKTWTSATSSQIAAWHTFALASFLLTNQGSEEFFFSGKKSDNGNSWYGDDKIVVGSPSGSLKSTSGGAYYRAYSKGMVVVNPTGGSLSVPLGAVYHISGGAAVSTVNLSAHTGMILTS